MDSPNCFEQEQGFLILRPSSKSPGLHADLTNLGHMFSAELIHVDRGKC